MLNANNNNNQSNSMIQDEPSIYSTRTNLSSIPTIDIDKLYKTIISAKTV